MARSSSRSKRVHRLWTAAQDAVLLEGVNTVEALAKRTGRVPAAIKARRILLARRGLPVPHLMNKNGNLLRPTRAGGCPISAPPRACALCAQMFAPTVTRRMLCFSCFRDGDNGPMAA